jgi:hypothetical protein
VPAYTSEKDLEAPVIDVLTGVRACFPGARATAENGNEIFGAPAKD